MTTGPRRIEADMPVAGALHRRTQLGWIVEDGLRVRVTNPSGGTWTGRVIALADFPAMLLERDDGRRVMLPQCFAVEQIGEGDAPPVPEGAEAECSFCTTRITLLGGSWTADDGTAACTDTSAPYVAHQPKEDGR